MLRQSSVILPIRASRCGLHDFTPHVRAFVRESGISEGLLTIFCRHTSASLLIQENAAPAAARDLEAFFARLAPEGGPYEHHDEGPDDMPAHLRSALTATQFSIPVRDGALMLGTWQGIYLFEHRRSPHEREIALHIVGE
jgi:secondary thiamine-phosphate synthase enzyme